MKIKPQGPGLVVAWPVLAWSLLCVVGCGSSPDRVNDSRIRDLSHPQLLAMLQTGETAGPTAGIPTGRVLLLDVRAPRHFAQGRLPQAVNIFLPQLKANDPILAQADNLIVYAQTWQDSLGPAAAKRLITLGYDNVYLYRGGVELWIARGGQLEGGE